MIESVDLVRFLIWKMLMESWADKTSGCVERLS